jgi:hypothetical protein
MSLKDEIIVNLEVLNYPLVKSLVIDGDPKDLNPIDCSKIINWLSKEMGPIFKLDTIVHEINNMNELASFKLEINSLLKELNSCYNFNSFDDEENMLTIVSSLCGYLYSARMLYVDNPTEWLVNIRIIFCNYFNLLFVL